MRKLSITIRDKKNVILQKIICGHIDACKTSTVLYHSIVFRANTAQNLINQYTIPESINHFSIIEGLITIYYDNGFEMEIGRLND
jgi:hypothetical protein